MCVRQLGETKYKDGIIQVTVCSHFNVKTSLKNMPYEVNKEKEYKLTHIAVCLPMSGKLFAKI